MLITAIYAGILGLMLVVLGLRVVAARRQVMVGVGDGGHPVLKRRIRAHGNFTEYVPMALLLMGMIEMQGVAASLLHSLGITLIIGRVIHAVNISRSDERIPVRVAGMLLTFGVIAVASIIAIYQSTVGYLLAPV